MSTAYSYYTYLSHDGVELFTAVILPESEGRFPTVIMRNPYVDYFQDMTEEAVLAAMAEQVTSFTEAGYAVVSQHCRGRGKSSGDCIPFIYERTDGLHLYDWIRAQPFYNGELFPVGGSYTTAVHYETMPFATDVKGAVLEIMDPDRYNCCFRNGFFKVGLAGGWYVGMYKNKTMPQKNYADESYLTLPMSEFSKTVFGEECPDLDGILSHPDRNDPFWDKPEAGGDTRCVLQDTKVPILLVTGFYDIFTGGIFDAWKAMSPESQANCALLVHPYNHGNDAPSQPVQFENGRTWEVFGNYVLQWLEYTRGKSEAPIPVGKVTYHKCFTGEWLSDDFTQPETTLTFPLGDGERSYTYNPYAPARFHGGLTFGFDGNAWQPGPDSRYDILSFFSPEFTEDTFVKGKMQAKLRVKSDVEDTCFYLRLSLVKEEGAYGLRDDINQISNFAPDYTPGEEIDMTFTFDEHAFVVKKGEKLRIDVSSSAFPYYIPHTNYRGLYFTQDKAKSACNTVIAGESTLTIPIV
ncbi:MAG: CocE/NonD family hydrolase [Clostridia bacterium]|nr:CocE/NonD family hydrolase [Clostridia bacterium]